MERYHEDWIKAYMEYSKFSEAPNKFHFWTAVSVIAGALRRRVWIDQGYFQWTPNFYIVFVAPPGIVSKSTTASIGMRLLRQIDTIKFGPDAITWQALAASLADSTEMFQIEGTGDYHSMSALTIVSSEFGTFLNPNDREMVDVLVSLWDGQIGTWRKATKTMGSDHIENPWINILACTTPAWIAGNFPEYMIGGGFTSRCVFVYGEEKRQLVAYPKDHLPKDFKEQERKLVHDLERISLLAGEYTLSPEGRSWGEEWYAKHHAKKPASLDNDRFAGYLARKQTHLHKLATVLAAAKRSVLVIEKEDLETADAIVTALEADMPRVFAHIGKTDEIRQSDMLIKYVQSVGKIDKIDLLRKMMAMNMDYKTFTEALEGAIHAGMVRVVANGGAYYIHAIKPPNPENNEGQLQ